MSIEQKINQDIHEINEHTKHIDEITSRIADIVHRQPNTEAMQFAVRLRSGYYQRQFNEKWGIK